MIQDEKELLFKDLCARFPYGVICDMWDELESESKITERLKMGGLSAFYEHHGFGVRPYLRPMSSITDKEFKEYHSMLIDVYNSGLMNQRLITKIVDWLDEKMFDHRGLIPKDLALEAPEGMYKTE